MIETKSQINDDCGEFGNSENLCQPSNIFLNNEESKHTIFNKHAHDPLENEIIKVMKESNVNPFDNQNITGVSTPDVPGASQVSHMTVAESSNNLDLYDKLKSNSDSDDQHPNISDSQETSNGKELMKNGNNEGSLIDDDTVSSGFVDDGSLLTDSQINFDNNTFDIEYGADNDVHISIDNDSPKPEDIELLARLEEANRLIEADSKCLTFSSDFSCCKEVSTSSSHSRQSSTSSEHSESSHKIGIPCSCAPPQTPEHLDEAKKELSSDTWSTWRNVVDEWDQYKKKKSFLKELVRKGIPTHFRGLVWPLLSGAYESKEKSKYKDFLKMSSNYEKFIRRDVSRTYPNHEMFKEEGGPGQESLFNIIKAYSLLDPEVGYCQGSAFVVGLLLMQMPEEDAYAVFVQVMYKYGLRELYKPSMARIGLCIYQLECMIQDMNSVLYNHFQMHGMFASTFATSWFLSLFATTLPLSLSSRVFDVFLSEGMDSIMMLSYAMVDICSRDLLKRNMEDMIKLLSKELPHELEGNHDLLFTTSFKVKFCPKKMKKLEKDYSFIKTKENEDNIERKRLRTENKLLRQRIERLEEETATLADRLIQDQVKYANQEEELYVLRRKLSLSMQAEVAAATKDSPDVVSTDGQDSEVKRLQAHVDELVSREVTHLANMHDMKMRVAELEKKNLENHNADVTDMQQQLILCKLREAETSTSAKELEQRVIELDKYWQKHQELMKSGDNRPKVPKAKIQLLTEELMSIKLKDTNMMKDLMGFRLKVVDLETKVHINERLIKKLEEENENLKETVGEHDSGKTEYESEIRILQRQISKAEAKRQNEDLMTMIQDAETSQMIAALKQQIIQLEVENQELLTAEKLYKGATQCDNIIDIDAKIEEFHQQIVQLRENKRSRMFGKLKNGKTYIELMKKNYSVESDSDLDDFDAVRYKMKDCQRFFGSDMDLNKIGNGIKNGSILSINVDSTDNHLKRLGSVDLLETGNKMSRVDSITSDCSNFNKSNVHNSSTDGLSFDDVILHIKAKRTASNPDILLDSDKSLDFSDFKPDSQSSPLNVYESCSVFKTDAQPPISKLNFDSNSELDLPSKPHFPKHLGISTVEDLDKTPTNERMNESNSSNHFTFGQKSELDSFGAPLIKDINSNMPEISRKMVNISPNTFPDILSETNRMNEIVKNNISSLIAGLDLSDKKCEMTNSPTCVKVEGTSLRFSDSNIISDRNLSSSLDILSRVCLH